MKTLNTILFYILLAALISVINTEIKAADQSPNVITSSTTFIYLKEWQIAEDTNPENPIQDVPDSSWITIGDSFNKDMYSTGNWLIKTSVTIKDSLSDKNVLGLFPFNFITAYEIYWDGIMIARNGKIGINKADEKPGIFNFNLVLPPDLAASGTHVIVVRLSNFRNYSPWKWLYGDVVIGDYDFVLKESYKNGYKAFFITGILFVAFLFNLFLYISRKRKTEHLLFSFVCLIIILDFMISQAPSIFNFPTTYILFEYIFYQCNTLLFTILFPVFLIYSFSLPKKTIAIILAVTVIVYLLLTNISNMFDVMSFTVLILSSAITVWALKLRREGSTVISIGLVLSWGTYFYTLAFDGLGAIMVICTSFSIAQQFAIKERGEKEAQLKSARLEIELLKKNINPHFVLNTLTSIIAWLRKDSNSAIKLIEALADEFRMINQISAQKQIPIKNEIDLCLAHLKIMSYRKGAEYKLETLDIDENDTIPPMIFHTLVENGLTHGYENKTAGTFVLQRKKIRDGIKYILTNDGDFNAEDSKGSTGFGAKYIRARLEENYPGRWEFTSNQSAGGWESVVEIRNA